MSPEGNRHLEHIVEHIAQDSPDRAVKLVRELEERFALLCDFPDMGTAREGKSYRYFPYGNYVIVYDYDETHLTIHGVRHAKLDIMAR